MDITLIIFLVIFLIIPLFLVAGLLYLLILIISGFIKLKKGKETKLTKRFVLFTILLLALIGYIYIFERTIVCLGFTCQIPGPF